MQTQVFRFVVEGRDNGFLLEREGSRVVPYEVRAVSPVHAVDRLACKTALNHGDVRPVEVEDRTDFDQRVNWRDAKVDAALELGLIDHPSESGQLGDTADPPLDEEVLDYVLDNKVAYGVLSAKGL